MEVFCILNPSLYPSSARTTMNKSLPINNKTRYANNNNKNNSNIDKGNTSNMRNSKLGS